MKSLSLNPDHILTTSDFPVHNEHILKMYFKMAKHDPTLLPPTPIFELAQSSTIHEENQQLQSYLNANPEIQYVMLDGSHKTTALALTHNDIHALIIESNEDILELLKMVESGELFSFASSGNFQENIADLKEHHSKSTSFETIGSKTRKMIEKKVIPQYMIDHYQSET